MVDCEREESRFLHSRINEEGLTPSVVNAFRTLIYNYYETHKRIFPWRETDNQYHIFVSEIMLQQTQTERVLEKYTPFISTFPDFSSVAHASLHKILTMWGGLGYNRRALNLKKTAEIVGSTRQIRGLVLKTLMENPHTDSELLEIFDCDAERVKKVLKNLEKEGFITRDGNILTLG